MASAFPLPLVQRLFCNTCDFFQGDTTDLDVNGLPVQGKCRKNTPLPILQVDQSPEVSNWPIVQGATDVCSYHASADRHPSDVPDPGGGQMRSSYTYNLNGLNLPYTNGWPTGANPQSPLANPSQGLTNLLPLNAIVAAFQNTHGGVTFPFPLHATLTGPAIVYGCGSCEYWLTLNGTTGTCRRLAPKPVGSSSPTTNLTTWLTTSYNDWCSYGVPSPILGVSQMQSSTTTHFGPVTTPN